MDTDDKQAEYVVQLICERFSSFAAVAGPLFAGEVNFESRRGNLYLTETRTWLFLGATAYDDVHVLSNNQISSIAAPNVLIRRLLKAMTNTIKAFQGHLELIETKAENLTALLGFYLGDSIATVVDAIALQKFDP